LIFLYLRTGRSGSSQRLGEYFKIKKDADFLIRVSVEVRPNTMMKTQEKPRPFGRVSTSLFSSKNGRFLQKQNKRKTLKKFNF